MGRSQRDKGANAEREVAKILESFGFPARRGQVFNGEPDIVCPTLPIHFEVKRHETLEIPAWFQQSQTQCRGNVPAVVYRQSYKPWMITMKAGDFLAGTTGWHVTSSDGLIYMKFEDFLKILKEVNNFDTV